jgi:hypothetical protein
MDWWQEHAQGVLRRTEQAEEAADDFTEQDEITTARRALIKARQDLVVMASLLDSLNRQVQALKFIAALILLCVVLIGCKVWVSLDSP